MRAERSGETGLLSGRGGPLGVMTFELWDVRMKGKPAGAEQGKAFQVGGTARAKARRWNRLLGERRSERPGER